MKTAKKIVIGLAIATLSANAYAAGDQLHPKKVEWTFDGMFGHVDKASAQRGLQVYKEVCAACHGLKRVAFRNLEDLGFSEAETKALAAGYTITDGPDDLGEMYDRPGIPSDRFVPPYPNENAARAAQNGAYPPDLSLMIKARPDGANYLYSLLTGYKAPPAGFDLPEGMHYNPYFPGMKIAMAAPLADDQVSYEDGMDASVDQMARDVVNFLQWAAEPEMEERKQMGLKVLLFLFVFTGFMYAIKKRIWARIKLH